MRPAPLQWTETLAWSIWEQFSENVRPSGPLEGASHILLVFVLQSLVLACLRMVVAEDI